MDFPTPEIQQELQRIRAALLVDGSQELRAIGKEATSLQLFLLCQAVLLGPTRDECAFNFAGLLASHQKLAKDLEPAEDMGLI
tara:strand:- start:246 stop:494 length:249 start_codon:yes stop_codon:yes gene_type:complete